MTGAMDAEKDFDKIQHPLMKKITQQYELRDTF